MLLLNPFWINSNLEARPHRVYLHGRPHLNLLFYFGFVSLLEKAFDATQKQKHKKQPDDFPILMEFWKAVQLIAKKKKKKAKTYRSRTEEKSG